MPPPFSTAFAGPQNVYIPAFQGKQTANLVVSYARDPKKFAVNSLAQRIPTNTLSGNWLTLRPEVLARVMNDPNEVNWVDGQMSPDGTHNLQDFRANAYVCVRRARTAPLGWQTRDQAVWDIQDTQLQALAHQMMTQRAFAFYSVLANQANYLSGNVKTATQWSNIGGTGGFWTAGTSSNPVVKRAVLQMANAIRKATMDAVAFGDMTLIISPSIAIALSTSPEIHDYMARSQYAKGVLNGDGPGAAWGLPLDNLYGVRLIVDGTLLTTSPRLVVPGTEVNILNPTDPGNANAGSDNVAYMIATPGSLGDNVGQVSSAFSTVAMFVYNGEEMVVETLDEPWHKRTKLRVSETYGFNIVAPETACLATNILA